MFSFLFLAPYARTTRYEEAFFSLENQGKKAHFARALARLMINIQNGDYHEARERSEPYFPWFSEEKKASS